MSPLCSLSRIKEDKPYQLYEALFAQLLKSAKARYQGTVSLFNNDLISLDATTIDLCLSDFPWTQFRKTKGAVKLHIGMNHKGNLD